MELLIAIGANILVGLMLWALFAWRRPPALRPLSGADEALEILRAHRVAAGDRWILSADGEAALSLSGSSDAVGLVQRHGRRWNVRALHPGDVQGVLEVGETLTIRLRDFGWPRLRLQIADATLRAACSEHLRALQSRPLSATSWVHPHA